MLHPTQIIDFMWAFFVILWIGSARSSSPTARRIGVRSELSFRIALATGALLLVLDAYEHVGALHLWSAGRGSLWLCVALTGLGLSFSLWARFRLGRFWSGQVVVKEGHTLIHTGPYRIVRHPIYTGLLLAIYADAAAKGTLPSVLGATLITVGLCLKARLEESWLRRELWPGAYDDYRRRVPMLIPFGPR